jgi:hypothetical protein
MFQQTAFTGLFALVLGGVTLAGDPDLGDPANLPPPPAHAIGRPSRAPELDVLPGFITPPPGYGVVSFYWWLGDPLTKERLTWQLDRLADMGIMGLQINYAHSDRGGASWGLTYPSQPPLFSAEWWKLVQWFAGEAKRRGMAISMSDYTLGWPGQGWYIDEILNEDPSLHGSLLATTIFDAAGGKDLAVEVPEGTLSAVAYPVKQGLLADDSAVDLRSKLRGRLLRWQVPDGTWKVVTVHARTVPSSIDPLNPKIGPKIVEKLFQRFEDHLPGESGKALNFFFSDELSFGIRGNLWHRRFADEFRKRKGYDVIPQLPALFVDVGPRTPKIRLDYNDVMVALEEECYFRPLFQWHEQRGMIYGCDHGGRGYDVTEFGDYFRTQRWMSGPGNDQPALGSAVIRTKVHSSIAHLYQRPRTWLEGYYGSGWGTTPAQLTKAGIENYCLGSTLQTFHGLYYSTHGGWWEWAPPCNHFRMPYWQHMKTLMTWTQRLCYLLSQGVHRCDVAILYPVATVQAGMDGDRAVQIAFAAAEQLFKCGIDFDFIDDQSLERATVQRGELCVAGESYRALILPAMAAVHYSTMEQAQRFARAGGLVIACGRLPVASDRVGRNDPQLDAMVKETFGVTAVEVTRIPTLVNAGIRRDFIPASPSTTRVLHRVAGPRDVFLVTGAAKGDECFFRATGRVERWDPWTGTVRLIHTATPVAGGTKVRLPSDASNGMLVVFSPGGPTATVAATNLDSVSQMVEKDGAVIVQGFVTTPGRKTAEVMRGDDRITVTGEAGASPEPMLLDGPWDFTLEPTLDNRFGDFRLPASDRCIGAEARRFRYADETAPNPGCHRPDLDTSSWPATTCGFGPGFWKLGPIPSGAEADALEAKLATLTTVDPAVPIAVAGKEYRWQPYAFSWREGVEGDPGREGYHGLKTLLSDDFIALGRKEFLQFMPESRYVSECGGSFRYFLWTTVVPPSAGKARLIVGGNKPAALYVAGKRIADSAAALSLEAGPTALLAAYDCVGRSHLVVQMGDAGEPAKRTPLAMRWYDLPGVLPFELQPERQNRAGWYRFTSPPGLKAMTLAVHGDLRAWVAGKSCRVERTGKTSHGGLIFRVTVTEPSADLAAVALRVVQDRGYHAGSAIPEPVRLDCGSGRLPPGDWSQIDGLACYSGAAWYRRSVTLSPERVRGRVTLMLGNVAASARVCVNGAVAGTLLAPPWDLDITKFVKAGENHIEIQVCNTLANHYLTIPTNYRGSPTSGLLGPVRIVTETPVELK